MSDTSARTPGPTRKMKAAQVAQLLRDALQPFAMAGEMIDNAHRLGIAPRRDDDTPILSADGKPVISLGDLRKARAALAAATEGGDR